MIDGDLKFLNPKNTHARRRPQINFRGTRKKKHRKNRGHYLVKVVASIKDPTKEKKDAGRGFPDRSIKAFLIEDGSLRTSGYGAEKS